MPVGLDPQHPSQQLEQHHLREEQWEEEDDSRLRSMRVAPSVHFERARALANFLENPNLLI